MTRVIRARYEDSGLEPLEGLILGEKVIVSIEERIVHCLTESVEGLKEENS